ncbi:MAG: prephenate dehydrogenase/arogenate dehydrogenase family protein [Opitutaceae bacterium]|nr:prephenate dehydrogenase/arogenate dehydrogenase family protein [Opitutaceae bacterium]
MFSQITILAPGLLGASVAKAVRSRNLSSKIHIWSRRAESRHKLIGVDWCDNVFETPEEAVHGSELVIICTPVEKIIPLVEQIASSLSSTTIVTDVGSVKSEITRRGSSALEEKAIFIGSHPMAGSEKTGMEHSSENLFEDRPCFITPLESTSESALSQLIAFWSALGSDISTTSPEAHDEIVAHISHLPHLIASALCSFLSEKDSNWKHFSGAGLSDSTRIASGDPKLWKEILVQNREEVLRSLRGLQEKLDEVHSLLANNDSIALTAILEQGKNYRDQLRPAKSSE